MTSEYLVKHNNNNLFQLKPDLAIFEVDKLVAILDTKWKLLDLQRDKYGLSQQDFYQLFAYGKKYLKGSGSLVLIYPKTNSFQTPLLPFHYSENLNLWVIPFCLESNKLILDNTPLSSYFKADNDPCYTQSGKPS